MVIENVCLTAVKKPWGSRDLRPWHGIGDETAPIGELWFERTDEGGAAPALLLKLLFTTQPLSIQVHPDDAYAHELGLIQGKTEAWFILSAKSDSEIALGLTRFLTAEQLRAAILDGSIAALVEWRRVAKDEVIFVPAGTIHALGAGLVILEVQQRSDTTFRLFDFGRGRRLDVEEAVHAANPVPDAHRLHSSRLTDVRNLLLASSHFTIELIDLPALSAWEFFTPNESWIFVLEGSAGLGPLAAGAGKAIFVQMELVSIEAGTEGFKCLVAYADHRPSFSLLRKSAEDRNSAAADFSSRLALHEVENSWVRLVGAER